MTSYKFGSFNLMNLGKTSLGNGKGITKRDFSVIAKIIQKEGFDVVAFQEILAQGKALDYLVKNYLKGWDYRWAEPADLRKQDSSKDQRGEGFAFVWNTNRLRLADSSTNKGRREYCPRIINEAIRFDVSSFIRMPYYARFVPVNGGFFEFRLINVHLLYGDSIKKRKEEYELLLEKVYPALSMERRYGNNREAYTIVMGDYNLNLLNKKTAPILDPNTCIEERMVNHEHQQMITVQHELTTLKDPTKVRKGDDNPNRGYANNYDHFSYDTAVFDRENIRAKYRRVDAVRKYYGDDFEGYKQNVSDHIPISLEIIMNGDQVYDTISTGDVEYE